MADTKSSNSDTSGSTPSATPPLVPSFDDFMKQRQAASAPPQSFDDFMQSRTSTKKERRVSEEDKINKDAKKFFAKHGYTREAILGAAGGAGIPETQTPVKDFAKGVGQTFTSPASTPDEIAVEAVAKSQGTAPTFLSLPAYRVAKGFIQQAYGYGQSEFENINWKELGRRIIERYPERSSPDAVEKRPDIIKDKEKFVHDLAGMTTMIIGALRGASKAGEGIRAPEGLTTTAQRMAGTGPTMVAETTAKTVGDIESANVAERTRAATDEQKYNDARADYAVKISRINEDMNAKVNKAIQEYGDDVAARNKKVSEIRAKHADEVAQARKQWVEKTHQARQGERAAAEVEGKREALTSGQQAYTKLIRDNVKQVHDTTRGTLDSRWEELREMVGEDRPVATEGVMEAIEKSRGMLAGVPADIKIFNDIFKEITKGEEGEGAEFVDTSSGVTGESGAKPIAKPVKFDDARTQYSALGEKAYGAEGNLRRALFNVYEAYDAAITNTVKQVPKASKFYTGLKADWSRYMKDWNDLSATATGGSPLARVYRAVDDPVVAAHVLGKFGDRLFATFARYDKFGANPALMSKLRNMNQEYRALPKAKAAPKAPGKFEAAPPPAEPESVKAPVEKVRELEEERIKKILRTEEPGLPAPADIKARPTMDQMKEIISKAKKQHALLEREKVLTPNRHSATLILLAAGGGYILQHSVGYAIPYAATLLGGAALVASDIGQRWLSRITPGDINIMQEIIETSPETKFDVNDAIYRGLKARVEKGEKLPLPLRAFKGILNSAQTGSLLRLIAPPQPANSPSAANATVQ